MELSEKMAFDTMEANVRKRWLTSLIIVTVVSSTIGLQGNTLFTILESALNFLCFYYFSYRRKGTLLLSFSLIVTPLYVIGTVVKDWKTISSLGSLDLSIFSSVSSLLLALQGYFLWNCWHLRKVNKEAPKYASLEYANLLKGMIASSTLEDLNREYSRVVSLMPQFERSTTKEYKRAKSLLIEAATSITKTDE